AADLAATTKAAGGTLLDLLDNLAVTHGLHLTEQISVRVTDLSRIGAIMAALRKNPLTELAGQSVTTEDLLPAADVFRLRGDGLRVIIRPSGTEPKIKAYLEMVTPVDTAEELAAIREKATARLAELHTEIAALLAD
ncbi:MAG TPA: phospho-sugar mutase, partial [Micromonosporaceae bacterium]